MVRSTPPTAVATLIGDVVGSRQAPDRRRLHDRLVTTLQTVNALVPASDELTVTVGDEFQGSYLHLGQAAHAALRVQLLLSPDVDVRFGIGWGQTSPLDDSGIVDGPGWWAARDAIDQVHQAQTTPARRLQRTACAIAADTPAPANLDLVAAALRYRDIALGAMTGATKAVLAALLDDRPQAQIAELLGISQSAVSQQVRNHGLMLIVDAERSLAALT